MTAPLWPCSAGANLGGGEGAFASPSFLFLEDAGSVPAAAYSLAIPVSYTKFFIIQKM